MFVLLRANIPPNTILRRKGRYREKKYLAAILYPEVFTPASYCEFLAMFRLCLLHRFLDRSVL